MTCPRCGGSGLDPEHQDPCGACSESAWLATAAKECRACQTCWGVPCGACQAGGVCDAYCSCFRDDELDEPQSRDDLDAEGEMP